MAFSTHRKAPSPMVLPVVLQQGDVPNAGQGFDMLDEGGVPTGRELDRELSQGVGFCINLVPIILVGAGGTACPISLSRVDCPNGLSRPTRIAVPGQAPACLRADLRLHGFGEFAEDPVAGVGAGVVDHEDVGVPDTLL